MTNTVVKTQYASAFKALQQELQDAKKQVFIKAFKLTGGNVVQMALGLKISRGTVLTYLNQTFGSNYRKGILDAIESAGTTGTTGFAPERPYRLSGRFTDSTNSIAAESML